MSTLNDPGAEFAYTYHAFELTFPQNALKRAQGKKHVRVFVIDNKKAGKHAKSFRGTDKIVRIARCRIPDTKQADTMLDKHLRNFGSGTWLDAAISNTKRKSADKSKSSGSWEWVCTSHGSINYWGYDEQTDSWALFVTWGCTSGYYNYAEEETDPGGGGPNGPGNDPAPPCNDPTLPCIEGGGDNGGDAGLTEEEIREEDLNRLLESDEFALLEVPCEEIKNWEALAQQSPPQSVINKLEQEYYGDIDILSIEDAAGTVVNMDYFSVNVTTLPSGMTAGEVMDEIRMSDINNFIDTGIAVFSPYDYIGYSFDEATVWHSSDPLGAVLSIDMPFLPGDGSVVVSDFNSASWTFSTLTDPWNFTHPVSGNRMFGFMQQNDGSYTFLTRGVDRITRRLDNYVAVNWMDNPFEDPDALWTSFQEKLKEYINQNGGNATFTAEDSVTYRPNWAKVSNILTLQANPSTLGCD